MLVTVTIVICLKSQSLNSYGLMTLINCQVILSSDHYITIVMLLKWRNLNGCGLYVEFIFVSYCILLDIINILLQCMAVGSVFLDFDMMISIITVNTYSIVLT